MICVTFRFFLQLADKIHATVQVGNYLAVLCVLWEDSIQSILYLKPVICFASPVATFHLTDARQVYGSPSLLRTIGSRVSLSPSRCAAEQYHSRDESSSLSANAYWLKYLLAVPLSTCNLLLAAAARERDHISSLRLSMFYGFHILTAKLCLNVPVVLELNVKQLSMGSSIWREPRVFWHPLTDWIQPSWARPGNSCYRVCQSFHYMYVSEH